VGHAQKQGQPPGKHKKAKINVMMSPVKQHEPKVKQYKQKHKTNKATPSTNKLNRKEGANPKGTLEPRDPHRTPQGPTQAQTITGTMATINLRPRRQRKHKNTTRWDPKDPGNIPCQTFNPAKTHTRRERRQEANRKGGRNTVRCNGG